MGEPNASPDGALQKIKPQARAVKAEATAKSLFFLTDGERLSVLVSSLVKNSALLFMDQKTSFLLVRRLIVAHSIRKICKKLVNGINIFAAEEC